jgi:putative oxidoreductase
MLELRNKQFWSQWAPLALRLVIGYGFLVHGLAKLGRGPQKFAGVLDWMGIPLPGLVAWVVTLAEIFGGLAILAGAFVLLVSIPLAIIHVVAMFGVHLQYGFSSVKTVGLTQAGPQFGPPGFEFRMNLNQVTVPCANLQASIAFYRRLGLRLIVGDPPDYARFECPVGWSSPRSRSASS